MIPGVETFHPRESWEQPGYEVASQDPPVQVPVLITQPVAHYTAADDLIDGDPGEHASDLPAYLAAIQRSYVRRGYSVGYLFAIDWLGGVWELRGFDYRSAANFAHNRYTAPLLFLVDGADPATAEAAASARAVWREFRRRSPLGDSGDFKTRPLGHGELYLTTGAGTPTACPGGGILNQLHLGELDLDRDPPPPAETLTMFYFRVAGQPKAVWQTASLDPGAVAVQVQGATYAALGSPDVIEISAVDATLFHYVDTLHPSLAGA